MPLSAVYSSNDVDLVAGELYSIEVLYAERLGDSKIKLFWESNSQPYELIESERFYNVLNSRNTPHLFEVIPAPTNETTTTLVDVAAIEYAIVNMQETHHIYARDVFGNSQNNQDDVFIVALTHNTEPDTKVNAVVTPTTTISEHEVVYTLVLAGTYTLRAYLQQSGVLFELADSPISVLCQVTQVDASNTRLEGEGVTDAMAGVVQEFTVILYDSGDNRL